MSRITIKTAPRVSYDAVLDNTFETLNDELNSINISEKNVMIISDTKVNSLYFSQVEGVFAASSCNVFSYIANECNYDEFTAIVSELNKNGFSNNDVVVSLGGKTIIEFSGFVASNYKNGVALINIPTTLLSMAESATYAVAALNTGDLSESVKTIYNPSLVFINTGCISTLEDIDYYSGFADIMKTAIIKSSSVYEWLIENMYEITDKDSNIISDMIEQNIKIQKIYLEKDSMRKNEARVLELGHTVSKALLAAKSGVLSNGECVALGIICAAHISYKRNMLSLDEYLEIRDMFVPFNLPITIENIDIDSIIDNIKTYAMNGSYFEFILLKKIGKAVIDSNVTETEIRGALEEIRFSEEDMME